MWIYSCSAKAARVGGYHSTGVIESRRRYYYDGASYTTAESVEATKADNSRRVGLSGDHTLERIVGGLLAIVADDQLLQPTGSR